MKKYIHKISLSSFLLLFPVIAFAEGKDLRYVVGIIIQYFRVAIYLIISLAVVTFVWNVYRYFFTEKDKKEAGMYVLYSTIGFFVILSLWGLVNLLSGSLELDNKQPNLPFGGSDSRTITGPFSPDGYDR